MMTGANQSGKAQHVMRTRVYVGREYSSAFVVARFSCNILILLIKNCSL